MVCVESSIAVVYCLLQVNPEAEQPGGFWLDAFRK